MKKNTLDDRDNVEFYLDAEQPAPKTYTFDQLEDLFKEEEFKALPWYKRAWYRFIVAFFQTINMN
jgi:hypothetical protein